MSEYRKVINPIPKPQSTKKTKGKRPTTPTKGVDMDAVALKEERRARNAQNRAMGKQAERRVAKLVGGERTPMSGAVKNSNRNLTGDVEVRDAMGRDFMKIEVKVSSQTTASGEKSISIKRSWLEQAFRESKEAHEIGALAFRFKNDDKDYFIFTDEDIVELIEKAKLGSLYEASIPLDNQGD